MDDNSTGAIVTELQRIRCLLAMNVSGTLDRDQAATFLGISTSTLDRMRSAGELPSPIRLHGMLRWRRVDLESFLLEQEAVDQA